ncbi:uncharacterized protein LOC113304065 [Papaver somniferum]|uniref:uncharacterized protein LOC113304065 n=1 Tax=Papaver somniferum TaxID=3469 RepID=UPI000E702B2E|nr:uncharacterized protein LOC113304065 [Papaver somniferum]
MAKISSSSILFCVGFLLLLITGSTVSDKAVFTIGTAPDGSECPISDNAGSTGTSRVNNGLSCGGCMKACFKKCGNSKVKIGLACRQMTATGWSCGCCCSTDH